MPPARGPHRGVGAMGMSSAQLQTVHVLKDITDRREAERRYRELFDNIQEGIFVLHAPGPLRRSQRRAGAHPRL